VANLVLLVSIARSLIVDNKQDINMVNDLDYHNSKPSLEFAYLLFPIVVLPPPYVVVA